MIGTVCTLISAAVIGDEQARVALENIILKHRDSSMRQRAQQALTQLG